MVERQSTPFNPEVINPTYASEVEKLKRAGYSPFMFPDGTVSAWFGMNGLIFCSQDSQSKPFFTKSLYPNLSPKQEYPGQDIYDAGPYQPVELGEFLTHTVSDKIIYYF